MEKVETGQIWNPQNPYNTILHNSRNRKYYLLFIYIFKTTRALVQNQTSHRQVISIRSELEYHHYTVPSKDLHLFLSEVREEAGEQVVAVTEGETPGHGPGESLV